jgi:riboflavin synthase
MFTGIIESVGHIREVVQEGDNRSFWVESALSNELSIDQSVAHQGVCLTVVELKPDQHRVTAIEETLVKTNLGEWRPGDLVNLERCLPLHGRLDGHIVQGHVDATGTCVGREDKDGSWEFTIAFPRSFAPLIIEKGSISLNGTSLTVFNVSEDRFTVAIIPYTFQHTSIHQLQPGHSVNLEFDLIGKYLQRHLQLQGNKL